MPTTGQELFMTPEQQQQIVNNLQKAPPEKAFSFFSMEALAKLPTKYFNSLLSEEARIKLSGIHPSPTPEKPHSGQTSSSTSFIRS